MVGALDITAGPSALLCHKLVSAGQSGNCSFFGGEENWGFGFCFFRHRGRRMPTIKRVYLLRGRQVMGSAAPRAGHCPCAGLVSANLELCGCDPKVTNTGGFPADCVTLCPVMTAGFSPLVFDLTSFFAGTVCMLWYSREKKLRDKK